MNKKWITIVLALLFALPGMASAKNEPRSEKPQPFLFTQKGVHVTASEQFYRMYNLPRTSLVRIVFFEESKKNTGLDEAGLKRAVDNGDVAVLYVKEGVELETAGIKGDEAKYKRRLKPGEELVVVQNGANTRPWFVLSCVNPVRPVVVLSLPATKQKITVTKEKKTTVTQSSTGEKSETGIPTQVKILKEACTDFDTIPVQDVVIGRHMSYGRHHYGSGTYINGVIHRKNCR